MPVLINLACGQTFDRRWTNLDHCESDEEIRSHDLRKPLPFPDNHADAIYCSHFLEHLKPKASRFFLEECHRCIKPGGILRIVVPDLERLTRDYLAIVDELDKGNDRKVEHNWIQLELFDQFTRNRPEGEMRPFLLNPQNYDNAFVRKRIGSSINNFSSTDCSHDSNASQIKRLPLWRIVKKFVVDSAFRTDFLMKVFFSRHYQSFLLYPSDSIVAEVLHMITPRLSFKELKEAEFRNSGEVHRQSFDRYNLKWILEEMGFVQVKQMDAFQSSIDKWRDYALDMAQDGSVRKADSLYMEATKSDKRE